MPKDREIKLLRPLEKDYVCGPRRIGTQTDPAATISTMKVALALSLVASAAAFSQVSRPRGDGQI
jgi:hypothetical protein